MPPSDNQSPDDGLLRRYLLGSLPEADAERLHELSVTDEQLAGRLDAVESDLVDAYVRDELSQENLAQFKTFYLSSPLRREKVQIAEGFLALERKVVAAPAEVKPKPEAAVPVRLFNLASLERSWWPMLPFPRFAFQLGLAAVFLALVIAGGYLLSRNVELRKQLTEARSQQAPDPRIAELKKNLDQQRSARDEAVKELQRARESEMNLDQLTTVSVLLPPPMRGGERMPVVSLRRGTDLVVLVLALESDDFPAYEANLKDPVANAIVWKSARLTAATGGDRKVLSISFRSGLLKPQNYIVDLKGIPNHGPAEVISGYPFRVMLQ